MDLQQWQVIAMKGRYVDYSIRFNVWQQSRGNVTKLSDPDIFFYVLRPRNFYKDLSALEIGILLLLLYSTWKCAECELIQIRAIY